MNDVQNDRCPASGEVRRCGHLAHPLSRLTGLAGLVLLPSLGFAQEGSPPGGSQEPTQISLVEAVRLAMEHHPSVAAARAGGEGARAEQREARSAWLPTMSFSLQATQYEEPMLVAPLHAFDPSSAPTFDRTLLQGGPSFSYTLWDGGAREARIRQTVAQVGAADATERAVAQGLTARVVAGYLEVLGKAGILDAHRQRIEALDAEAARVRQLQAVGRAARLEALRVEAALASARAEQEGAASALEVAEWDLSRLIGAGVDRTRAARLEPVSPTPMALDRDPLLEQALRENPAVEEARRQIVVASAGVSMAGSAYLPRIGLVGNYLSRSGDEFNPSGEWSAGVQLSIPVFTGGAIRSRVAQARAWEAAAEQQVRLAELDVARDLDRALARVRETEARIGSLEAAVESYEEVVRTERLALEAGAGVQTDYLIATADLLQVRASLVEARYAAVAARAEVARVAGQLTQDWISNLREVEG